MRSWYPVSLILMLACSGDDAGTVPAPQCDTLETTPLGNVAVDEWPEGTLDAHATLQAFPGRYSTIDDCTGTEVFVKILVPDIVREDIDLVTSPYTQGPCGCTTDLSYSADSEYDMVGIVGGSSVFVENGVEAGAENATVFTDLALFTPGSPLSVRACGSRLIEPYKNSEYDEIQVSMRILNGGVYDGSYTLLNDSESLTCNLTSWALIAVE